jgi:HEAT repeat protein
MRGILIAVMVWAVSGWVVLAVAANRDTKQLSQAANSGEEPARLQAIDTLGGQTDVMPEVIKILSEQLTDRSAMVRAHAAPALREKRGEKKPHH